ncbi:LytR/AlgR family response regulator transcription factor [Algoriphagus sp.]|uniref:LytR/AlgR family response regulator transcription factor n=1 Tax=Algoriphagus sp. TaxID=1872435 RepID=UPI003F711240
MTNILILEDELPARKKLKRYLGELQLEVEILAEIDSVSTGIAYLKSSPALDLIISDIELRDGNAFEIFAEVQLPCPIIFTTAYNEYWMQAFESNGIAYLLKPFGREKFQMAWDKFQVLTQKSHEKSHWLKQLQAIIEEKNIARKDYKARLSVPTHKGNYFLEVEEVVYFEAEGGLVYGYDRTGKKHLMKEATLKEIESQLDPDRFFRINRGELVHKSFVVGTERYSKNSVAVKLSNLPRSLICSQSQTPAFLTWIER